MRGVAAAGAVLMPSRMVWRPSGRRIWASPAAQHAHHHRLHHRQREQRRHRGVHRVAALHQHLHPGGGGQRMVGHHHAAGAGGGLLLAGEGCVHADKLWRFPRSGKLGALPRTPPEDGRPLDTCWSGAGRRPVGVSSARSAACQRKMSDGASTRRLSPSSLPARSASANEHSSVRRSRNVPSARATRPVRCRRRPGSGLA